MNEAQLEREADRIYEKYDRAELFPEFLEIFSGEIDDKSPVCIAVKQRDFEALGGLLVAAFEEHLSECAEYDARRALDYWA